MKHKILGYVSHKSKSSGNIILKARTETRINEKVYNKKGNQIGKVFDIFGPVNSPFISIRLKDGQEVMIGKPLFINEKQGKKKYRKKKK